MLTPRVALLPVELQQQLKAELRPGEKQIWAAQPVNTSTAWLQMLIPLLFGLPFAGFAIFWIHGAAGQTLRPGQPLWPNILFPLFGVPFALAGLSPVLAPFLAIKRAKNTVYAITNQRVIIFAGKLFGGFTVESFEPERLTSMTRTQRASGIGDLIFEQFTQRQGSGTTTVRRGFKRVENVQQVEELIHSTLLADRSRLLN